MATLLYQGHGSYRITSNKGFVIYLDPYVGEGYDRPADLALITHEHGDHNKLELLTMAPGSKVLRAADMLQNGIHRTETFEDVRIEAVTAQNKNHDPSQCVGYLLTLDGITLYAAGDTSTTEDMKRMAPLHLDYALLPIDGVYNMDAAEASACATLIGAKHTIPIHTTPGKLYDRTDAERFTHPTRLLVEPGEEIVL